MLLFVLDILTHLVFLHFRPLHHQKNQYVVMSMQKKKKRKEILREKIHSLLNYLGCKNVLLRMLLRMQSLIFWIFCNQQMLKMSFKLNSSLIIRLKVKVTVCQSLLKYLSTYWLVFFEMWHTPLRLTEEGFLRLWWLLSHGARHCERTGIRSALNLKKFLNPLCCFTRGKKKHKPHKNEPKSKMYEQNCFKRFCAFSKPI